MKDNYYSLQDTNRKKMKQQSQKYMHSNNKGSHSNNHIHKKQQAHYKKQQSHYKNQRSSSKRKKTNYEEQQAHNKKTKNAYNRQQSYKSKQQANYRKRQARKLNYKKVFIFLLIVIAIFYFIISGIIKLFSGRNNSTATTSSNPPQDITINMAVVGDIMCHTTNFHDAYDDTNDTYNFSKVFVDIQDYIKNADLAIGNLETTFAGKDVGYTGYPTFNTPEQLAKNISDIGIDVVSTANNHSLDKRYDGLVHTLDELDKVGLSHTGTYRSKEEQDTILVKNINGITFAFLSFTYGTNGIPVPSDKTYCVNLIDETLILDQISKAKSLNPDVICVNMHWGDEYKLVQNSTQEDLAKLLFSNGVDIILGSHPHVLQPMEKRTILLEDGTTKEGFLIYSLGNFMSGQVIENTRNSIILQLQITKHADNKISIDSYNYVPIYMLDNGAGSKDRYKILDINKCISDFEAGNSSVSEKLYNTLKSSKDKIEKILNTEKSLT